MEKIQKSQVLSNLGLERGKYFVVSVHREENINSDKNFNGLLALLNQIAEKYKYPIFVSTHPRTRKKIQGQSNNFVSNNLIQWHKPFGFCDYNALQINAYAVLSDSGTISEESSILNFRALNIREAHERPEAMEEGSVMMVGMSPDRVEQGLEQLENQAIGTDRNFRTVRDYSISNVSDKVVRIILSYTDFINRRVWGKQ
jgi:UDP-N-acetylglucosamine 2-epimerase (non-hydrolysing)